MNIKLLVSLSSVLSCLNPEVHSKQPQELSSNASAANPLPTHDIGELQEKWQFTSDHLPMGATLDGFHIVSWNVLNSEYMAWVEMNTQGMRNSLIMKEHVYVNDSGLTVRDQHVIDQIMQMVDHPTHPRSILALQECSRAFLSELKAKLPENMKIVYTSATPSKDQNVIIYDSNLFSHLPEQSAVVSDAFPSSPRPLMDIRFCKKDTQETYRFVNAHVPGDPLLPGRYEMANYALRTQTDGEITVVLGDMNFDHAEMAEAFELASTMFKQENPYVNYANYYSNVGINKEAKCIDHIFISFGGSGKYAEANQPEEVLPGLQSMVDLLNFKSQSLKI